MRFLLLMLTLFWTSSCGGGVHGAPAPEFDAQAEIDAWVALWNSYDLNLVDDLFLTDDTVTYLSSEKEGLTRGIDAVREHHRGFGFVEGGKVPENELWVEDMVANTYGSTAVVTGIWFFGDRSQDRETIQRGPMTLVYVLKGNDYRLAHLHFANY